ncbi:sortase [Faecalicatena contorta]|uniref:sortase n=1 Tax=Faecalicatena contorta TaxID=39482 RepID=UPI001F309569|nr:sortase [Faecalicatena contorta]MCF2683176.1 sortase [Faecalicatena contorta]
MKRKIGNVLMAVGTLLILAALCLTIYNIWESRKADQNSLEILAKLEDETENEDEDQDQDIPPYQLYPDMEMPVYEVDGIAYIGVLEIPVLGLKLPVASEWSYPNLRSSPCRYQGSAYQDNMIIAGHNYNRHFGRLKDLGIGDEIRFTDAEGNIFNYLVEDLESIPGTAVEDMEAGEWDMTLFTCTYGGKSRVTIRCRRIE